MLEMSVAFATINVLSFVIYVNFCYKKRYKLIDRFRYNVMDIILNLIKNKKIIIKIYNVILKNYKRKIGIEENI